MKLLAGALGIDPDLVRNWKDQIRATSPGKPNKNGGLFKRLEIDSEPSKPIHQTSTHYIEGKCGVRVMGLSLEQMVQSVNVDPSVIAKRKNLEQSLDERISFYSLPEHSPM